MSEKVQVYVYDVTRGMAGGMSMGLLGKQIDGIWHTAIVAYGGEYFFGADGINMHMPPGTIPMLGAPQQVLEMGETHIPRDMFHDYLNQVGSEAFRGDRYHLTDRNCNNFSHEASQFLTGNGIPDYILSLPHEILSTPMGQMFKPMLDQMMTQIGPAAGDSMPHFGSVAVPAVAPDTTDLQNYTSTSPAAPSSNPTSTTTAQSQSPSFATTNQPPTSRPASSNTPNNTAPPRRPSMENHDLDLD